MLSIAITYAAIHNLFSAADYFLKVICHQCQF